VPGAGASGAWGLEVAGGTHPDGIDALLTAGVNVRFVDRLHTKIYSGRSKGVVIGSANLSQNALGDGGLIEAGMFLPPGNPGIDAFLASLRSRAIGIDDPRFPEVLHRLRIEDMLERQRNPQKKGDRMFSKRMLTFGEWLEMPCPEQWQLGLWSENVDPPKDAINVFKEMHGAVSYTNWRSGSHVNELQPGTATIDCQLHGTKWGVNKSPAPFWWYPEKPIVSAQKNWAGAPYQWFARVNVPAGRSGPFDVKEARFRTALDAAVRDFGERTEGFRGSVKKRFLDALAKHYNAT
jgi:hypothetical protein